MRRAALVSCVTAVAVLSACSDQSAVPGSAGPAVGQGVPGSPSSSSITPSTSPAPGPEPIDVEGKDPCTVIPDDVLASLGSSPAKLGKTRRSETELACSFRDINGIYGYGLFFDSGESFEIYASPSPGKVVIPSVVAGRDAYAVQIQELGGCTVAVDAGPNRSVSANRTGPQEELVAPLCDSAAAFVTAAITALTSN